jgi:hypothetical protein
MARRSTPRIRPDSSDFRREPSVVAEKIERRRTVRGPRRDLTVTVGGLRATVLEAGPKGLFVGLDDPDQLALGARLEVTIEGHRRRAVARAEVVRKEIHPRRGAALLLVHLSPQAEADYRAMLDA